MVHLDGVYVDRSGLVTNLWVAGNSGDRQFRGQCADLMQTLSEDFRRQYIGFPETRCARVGIMRRQQTVHGGTGSMARIARVVLAGHPHHVNQRGNRRQKVFFREADSG